MFSQTGSKWRCWLSAVLLLFVVGVSPARADILTLPFAIDASQSYVTLSGDVEGLFPLLEQAPGSLTTAFGGSLSAQLARTGGVFTDVKFDPINTMTVADQAGPFQPFNAPGELAAQVSIGSILAVATYRNSVGHLNGGFVPISLAGSFPLSAIRIVMSTTLDAEALPLAPAASNPNTLNELLAGSGNFSVVGNTATLIVPFTVSISSNRNDLGVVLNQTFTGQIVATATVPEPSSWMLAAGGMLPVVGLLLLRKRVSRRSAKTVAV